MLHYEYNLLDLNSNQLNKVEVLKISISRSSWISIISATCFAFAFSLIISLVLFYKTGAYYLDAGLFVHSLASSDAPAIPSRLQSHLGPSIFGAHLFFTPFIIFRLFGVFLHPVDSFVVFMATQHALLVFLFALVISLVLNKIRSNRRNYIWVFTLATMMGFSNLGLGPLLYPHPELIGSIFCSLGLVFLVIGQKRWIFFLGATSLLLGLLTREDMGVHVAVATLVIYLLAPRSMKSRVRKLFLYVTLSCGFVAASLIVFQKFAFPGGGFLFTEMYSGTPPYQHLMNFQEDVVRLLTFIATRWDLSLVTILGFAVFLMWRSKALLVFSISSLPWTFLNLTALDPAKASLATYHQFPYVLYLIAAALYFVVFEHSEDWDSVPAINGDLAQRRGSVFAATSIVISLFLSGISLPPVGSGYFLNMLVSNPIPTATEIEATHESLLALSQNEGVMIDDAVMTLETRGFDNQRLTSDFDGNLPGTLAFNKNYQLGKAKISEILSVAQLEKREISVSCLSRSIVSITFGNTGSHVGAVNELDVSTFCK